MKRTFSLVSSYYKVKSEFTKKRENSNKFKQGHIIFSEPKTKGFPVHIDLEPRGGGLNLFQCLISQKPPELQLQADKRYPYLV